MTIAPLSEEMEPSNTSRPLAVPSSGDMNTSPQGMLPPAPGRVKSPSSLRHRLPLSPMTRSVPAGVVTRTSAAAVRTDASAAHLDWSSG